MDMTYDWRSFQSVFYPQRRASVTQGPAPVGPIYLVVEGDTVISAYADHEDFSGWIGGSYRELGAQVKHRDIIAFERESVDQWISGALVLPNFYEQVQHLGAAAAPKAGQKKDLYFEGRRHFLLEAIQGWWAKVLPSSYGLYLRLEGAAGEGQDQDREILLLIRRGSFAGFLEPDLSSMGAERRKQPADVVKYLSEKYLVPVQGLFVPAKDWAEWSQCEDPWGQLAKALRSNRMKMVPFKWGMASLIATRAYLGV